MQTKKKHQFPPTVQQNINKIPTVQTEQQLYAICTLLTLYQLVQPKQTSTVQLQINLKYLNLYYHTLTFAITNVKVFRIYKIFALNQLLKHKTYSV